VIKKLVCHGNSDALIIDKSVLELLNINNRTSLRITTDGKRIIIDPQHQIDQDDDSDNDSSDKKIRVRESSIRGGVRRKWQESERKDWSVRHTMRACFKVDEALEKNGKNPAPQFRSYRKDNDEASAAWWVECSRFSWLAKK